MRNAKNLVDAIICHHARFLHTVLPFAEIGTELRRVVKAGDGVSLAPHIE